MIVAQEMENAVNKEIEQFPFIRMSVFLRLTPSHPAADHHIAQTDLFFVVQFAEIVILGKRENVSHRIFIPISGV